MTATAPQLVLDLPLPDRSGRADFLAAPSNAAALAMIDAAEARRGPGLLLMGPAGSGRSHLARIWAAETGAAAVDGHRLEAALPALLAADRPAMVDDADAVAGHAAREEALFHLLNHARAAGRPVLLVAGDAPGTWGLGLPDLESRLHALPAARTGQPDDALLLMVLAKLCDERQLAVPGEVLDYLVPRMERSLAAARRLTARIDALALARHRRVTRALAAEALAAEAADAPADPSCPPRSAPR